MIYSRTFLPAGRTNSQDWLHRGIRSKQSQSTRAHIQADIILGQCRGHCDQVFAGAAKDRQERALCRGNWPLYLQAVQVSFLQHYNLRR